VEVPPGPTRFSPTACCSEGIELSEREWADPVLRAAAEARTLVGTLDNDRYSYFRERDLAVKKHNLVDVLRVDDPSLSFAQAVHAAVALRDRIMCLYLRLREQLRLTAGDDGRGCVAGLDAVGGGNMNFAAKAARYLLPEMPTRSRARMCPATTAPLPPNSPRAPGGGSSSVHDIPRHGPGTTTLAPVGLRWGVL
jgi:hypothetical protein